MEADEKAITKSNQKSLFPDLSEIEEGKHVKLPTNTLSQNRAQSVIIPIISGAPVVFHGDTKKIKDANLYCGCACPKNSQGKCPKGATEDHILRDVYSPKLYVAAEVGMIDYIPNRHKEKFKYVVIFDSEFREYVSKYRGEYGAESNCAFISASDFFASLSKPYYERYFRKNKRPIRTLVEGTLIHVGDYTNQDEMYDDAVSMGLEPLRDLPGKECAFKYIVSKKTDFDKYANHHCDLFIAKEFEHLISYTIWMRLQDDGERVS